MISFEPSSYCINDFIEWYEREQLEISPKFQRRSVWSLQAKSYLIDSIIRNKPMPKIFIRQKTNPKTMKTTREIVDGQQRMRTILSFVQNGFKISKVHNEDFGGKLFSELPDEQRIAFLNYRISVDILHDVEDEGILDIFARLNTYAVQLKKQELLNAKYFGYFKQLVYDISRDFYTFWLENGIFTDKKIMRMAEAELVSDLIIAALEGIQSKKNVEKYYKKYDESFDNRKEIKEKVTKTLDLISTLYGDNLRESNLKTTPAFYGIFVSLYHLNYGIQGIELQQKTISEKDYPKIINAFDEINDILDSKEGEIDYFDFVKSTKDATTDVPARKTRCIFMIKKILEYLND